MSNRLSKLDKQKVKLVMELLQSGDINSGDWFEEFPALADQFSDTLNMYLNDSSIKELKQLKRDYLR